MQANTKPAQPPASYNLSKLSKGVFFNAGYDRRLTATYVGVWAAVILGAKILEESAVPAGYAEADPKIGLYGLLVLLGIAWAVVVTPVYVIWISWLRQYFYKRARNKFIQANNLQLLDHSRLMDDLPQSLLLEGKDSNEAIGCKLTIGNVEATVFDYTTIDHGGYFNKRLIDKKHHYAVVTLRFNKRYPHLFLDSRKNGRSHTYSKKQKIELEGKFADYFDLYMPEGSQAGALTIFSPDVMQTIIDYGRPFDIEVEDNRVSLIGNGYAYTAENLQMMLACASTLSKEFEELNTSWRPVKMAAGKPFELKPSNAVIWIIIAAVAYIIVSSF